MVIGGDGSLTGANLFKTEWPDLLEELKQTGRIEAAAAAKLPIFQIIGLVGSIDNDMCGFSTTIGADTAMQRIVDACDALITTAESHQRSFIVEVMGRHCGYLALASAIAVGADWVFVPERPPEVEDWETHMCGLIEKRRKHRNFSLVIIAEGATDRCGREIEAGYVKKVLSTRLGHDTRVTCLGHVQRGGSPSAFDRIQGCRLGAEAAHAILNFEEGAPSRIVGLRSNQVVQLNLTKTIEKTQALTAALKDRRYEQAMAMRGPTFCEMLDIYNRLRKPKPPKNPKSGRKCKILTIHAGSPSAGMNPATKTIVRSLINQGHAVFGSRDGFPGIANGVFFEFDWHSVEDWSGSGGSKLGTNRYTPEKIGDGTGVELIAASLETHNIDALIVVGGFEAYQGILTLYEHRDRFDKLKIPMCCVPATINNNVPGTEISIGADTAINAVVDAIDRLKLSAESSRARLFLVETMGGSCGYLTVMGGLAGGADATYIHETETSIEVMQTDVEYLRKKFAAGFKKAVIVRNESCSRLYGMRFMQALFEQEGQRRDEHSFTVRNNVLGHLQQGNSPSPLDRVYASRLGCAACNFIQQSLLENTDADGNMCAGDASSAVVIGLEGSKQVFSPVESLVEGTDFTNRRNKVQWWLTLQPLVRMLELNNCTYICEQYEPQSTVLPDHEI